MYSIKNKAYTRLYPVYKGSAIVELNKILDLVIAIHNYQGNILKNITVVVTFQTKLHFILIVHLFYILIQNAEKRSYAYLLK